MASLSDAQLAALTRRHIELAAQIRARVVQYIESAWGALRNWRDADIDEFIARIVPIVEGGQVRMASLTDAFLAQLEQAALGTPARPVGIVAASVVALRGEPTAAVYRRAGIVVWTALAAKLPVEVAVTRGRQQAVKLAETDLQMARTHAARQVLSGKDNVTGYRRTLTGSESCGLCAVASTRRYGKDRLMPIHPGCDCGISPIYSTRDIGQVVDPDRLAGIKDQLAERFGADNADRKVSELRDLVVTHEHPELGPLLVRAGDRFTA